ncbi:hypothetical protein HBNXHr_2116 [Halorhabdus sp. BNX81]|nr:hypothetical protein HBNXHr_2116 [Halorhabdus sp. BNX81]
MSGADTTDVGDALEEGLKRLRQLPVLLAVPTLVTLLSVGDLRMVLDRGSGSSAGVKFAFPAPIGDLWTFVDTPDPVTGGVAPIGVVDPSSSLVIVVFGSVLSFLLYGVLTAGYLGSIQAFRRRGGYDFLANVRAYALTYVGLSLVIFGAGLVVFVLAFAVPLMLLVTIPLMLAVGYLFWGSWFLVPVANLEAIPALQRSYRLAVSESDYAVWALAHFVLVGILSLVATPFVMNSSVVGVVLGLAVVVPVGFVLTVGSLRVIDDLADRSEPNQEPDDAFETY